MKHVKADVIVLNARDERAIAWLIAQVGFDAVQQACGRIAGRRKLYPSNVAKTLGLAIPETLSLTPPDTALARIGELRARFGLARRRG